MSMKKYMIRDLAQKPIRVNLRDPATNAETGDWIDVRSSLSDEFTVAREEATQAVQSIQEPDPKKRAAIVKELQLGLKVALLAGWSFDEPFTDPNAREFLAEAPQVQNLIMAVADDSASFFSRASENSSGGRSKK